MLLLLTVVSLIVSGCSQKPGEVAIDKDADNDEKERVEQIKLNVVTAGDTNMEELLAQAIGVDFKNANSNVSLNVVGTGAGDAGSQNIHAKLKAQKEAGKEEWDMDVAIVHQSIMAELMKDDLLEKYVPLSANKEYVNSEASKNSLGVNVDGYVIPMFRSQVALAYNPDRVSNPPETFEELVQWIKENPRKFGYNGIQNGMSGVAFVTAYAYWRSGDYKDLTTGPYDAKLEEEWPAIMKELKGLPVTYTNGNNGTLDMLNRGEIDMGPAWVDMFLLWKSEGRMNPDFEMKLIEPGLPGQPMYVVIPKNAKNKEWGIKFADYLTSPEIQGKYIVERNTWYPGIDASAVLPFISKDSEEKLFKEITADDLAQKSQVFPIVEFFNNLKTAYEIN